MRKSRYQKGSVKKQRGRWVAMWWVNRSRKSRVIGLVRDMTKSDARAVVDRIVAEVNNGGEMVEATLRVIDPNLAFAPVYASHGKITRAEPVAALYEQGKVHHLGAFPQLEDQMCNLSREVHHDFGGRRARHSPDRVDALVWALTDLLLEPMPGEGIYEVYHRLSDQLSDTTHQQRSN